jgi:hypothetical protein
MLTSGAYTSAVYGHEEVGGGWRQQEAMPGNHPRGDTQGAYVSKEICTRSCGIDRGRLFSAAPFPSFDDDV